MTLIQKRRLGVLGSALALSTLANASGSFTVPAELTAAQVNVGIVGAAVFAIAVGIMLWKWYRRSLS